MEFGSNFAIARLWLVDGLKILLLSMLNTTSDMCTLSSGQISEAVATH